MAIGLPSSSAGAGPGDLTCLSDSSPRRSSIDPDHLEPLVYTTRGHLRVFRTGGALRLVHTTRRHKRSSRLRHDTKPLHTRPLMFFGAGAARVNWVSEVLKNRLARPPAPNYLVE